MYIMYMYTAPYASGAVEVGRWSLATARHALTSPGTTHRDGGTTERTGWVLYQCVSFR